MEKPSHVFKCETFNYSCKKDTTIKKHITINHSEQNCKYCSQEFSTSCANCMTQDHHEQEESSSAEFHSKPKSHLGRKEIELCV